METTLSKPMGIGRDDEARTFMEALALEMDGKPFTLDGVSGMIWGRILVFAKPYSGPNRLVQIYHAADEAGRETHGYREMRAYLRDDYLSELSLSDRLIDIALELGINVDQLAAEWPSHRREG